VASVAGLASVSSGAIAIQSFAAASTEGLGAFTGSFNYVASNATQGTLTITLTNTSVLANGGFLTAFVFNSVNSVTGLTLSSGPANFSLGSNVSAAPFGTYRHGVSTGGGFLGGGNPSRGLAVGATGTFVFAVTASTALALTENSFLDGSNDYPFVVRFRGFENGGSDKVPTPTPGSLALGLIAGLTAARRRRA
jgi:MYXO-CTERM domain-containing protein